MTRPTLLLAALALPWAALPGCVAVEATTRAEVKAELKPADERPGVTAGLVVECRWKGGRG